jgi:hypothetical protein
MIMGELSVTVVMGASNRRSKIREKASAEVLDQETKQKPGHASEHNDPARPWAEAPTDAIFDHDFRGKMIP